MGCNLKKAEKFVQKCLKSEWSGLDFEYELKDDEFTASASLTLKNHTDDIRVLITVYSGGMAHFRAVFDKIDKEPEAYILVNTFNDNNSFFKAFIREEGYVELSHVIALYSEDTMFDYTDEFLSRLAKLADNKDLQNITAHTH